MSVLWKRPQQILGGLVEFFLVCLAHDTLYNFYKMNFALMQYHKYPLGDIDNMIPFEREIYIAMLIQYLDEEKQRLQKQQ